MPSCCVRSCGVNKKTNPDNCTFHRIPLDPVVREKWLILIGRIGWTPGKNSTVCSKHFPDKFKRKIRKNTMLLKDALPTLFVPGHYKEEVPSSYVCLVNNVPSTSQEQERNFPPSKTKKLMTRNLILKQKLREKQKRIRTLVAKTKRQAFKIATLEAMVKEFFFNTELKDHYIEIACGNEFIQNLFNRVEDEKCGT